MSREITIQLSEEALASIERRAAKTGGSVQHIVESLVQQGSGEDEGVSRSNKDSASGNMVSPDFSQEDINSSEAETQATLDEAFESLRGRFKLTSDMNKTDDERIAEYLDEKYG